MKPKQPVSDKDVQSTNNADDLVLINKKLDLSLLAIRIMYENIYKGQCDEDRTMLCDIFEELLKISASQDEK